MAKGDQRAELAMWIGLLLTIVGATTYLSTRLTKIEIKLKIISSSLPLKTRKVLDGIDQASAVKLLFAREEALLVPGDNQAVGDAIPFQP